MRRVILCSRGLCRDRGLFLGSSCRVLIGKIREEPRSTSLGFQRRSRNICRCWLGEGGVRGSGGDEGNERTRIGGTWGKGGRCGLSQAIVLATCGVWSWLREGHPMDACSLTESGRGVVCALNDLLFTLLIGLAFDHHLEQLYFVHLRFGVPGCVLLGARG